MQVLSVHLVVCRAAQRSRAITQVASAASWHSRLTCTHASSPLDHS